MGLPDFGGLVVAGDVVLTGEGGYCQLVVPEAQVLGEELVAERDGFLLEVVAQGPVAEHLEECQVGIVTDLVDVPGPHALLVVAQPRSHWVLLSEEIGHQRVHTGGGEEYCGVVLGNE